MASDAVTYIYLPDVLASCDWPWERTINPHHAEVQAASDVWFASFKAFSPKASKAFDDCDFSERFSRTALSLIYSRPPTDLLGSLLFPTLDAGEQIFANP